jgi:hypothetical protein
MLFLFGMCGSNPLLRTHSIDKYSCQGLAEAGALLKVLPLSRAIRQKVVVDSEKAGIRQLIRSLISICQADTLPLRDFPEELRAGLKARSLFLEPGSCPDASQGFLAI